MSIVKVPCFLVMNLKCFREDIVTAISNPSIGKLEEYEGLVPDLVNTHKEVASRVTEANNRLVRLQQRQDNRLENIESSFSNYVGQSNQQNQLLMSTTQQLSNDIKIIMLQQQCLNAQMQLFMATNNASQNAIGNTNLAFPALPSASPMQAISFPSSAPSNSRAIQQQPTILPSPTVPNNVITSTASSKPKTEPKKKTRWVSYKPNSSE